MNQGKWFCFSLTGSSYRVFSLTWPASTQIYWNKRKRLHKKRVQFPEDWFGAPSWPPFHCFGTPIWPPWRHVKTLYMVCSRGFESWQDPGGLLDELPTLTQPWRTAWWDKRTSAQELIGNLSCVHTLLDSFCLGKKIVPDRASVHI